MTKLISEGGDIMEKETKFKAAVWRFSSLSPSLFEISNYGIYQ